MERLEILPLSSSDATRFTEAWGSLRSRFVDNPKWTVTEAEQLVRELVETFEVAKSNSHQIAASVI